MSKKTRAAADEAILRLHLASEHALAGLGFDDPVGTHEHEHDGPCTIRDHPRKSRHWDPEKVAAVIVEAAEMDGLVTFTPPSASPDRS